MPSRLPALAIVLCVLVAGCASPFGTDSTDDPTTDTSPAATTTPPPGTTTTRTPTVTSTATPTDTPTATSTDAPTPTPTPEPDPGPGEVAAVGLAPDYDLQRTLDRVERLRGLNATRGIRVVRKEPDEAVVNGERVDRIDESFFISKMGARTLQLSTDRPTVPVESPGFSRRPGRVKLLPADYLRRQYDSPQEAILAHELVHALQQQHGLFAPRNTDRNTTDGGMAVTAVSEGDALYTEVQYRRRYLSGDDGDGTFTIAQRNRSYSRAAWLAGLYDRAYVQGYRYVERRNLSVAERNRLQRQVPETTAELLHPALDGRVPGDPVPVPTDLTAGDGSVGQRNRLGELATRYVLLVNGVPYARATEAATGWRNDTFVTYNDPIPLGSYWGTRWANASEAREFATAWRDTLDRLNATRNGSVIAVPATEHRPATYYVVERDGAVVHVAAGKRPAVARRVADAVPDSTGDDGDG